jgi:hypothetical protein
MVVAWTSRSRIVQLMFFTAFDGGFVRLLLLLRAIHFCVAVVDVCFVLLLL